MNNLDLATLLFGPTPSEAYSFTEPQQEEMDEIHGWCTSDLVALPSAPLPSSDGMISPLDPHELEELSDHLRSGHATKSNLCRGCLQSEGPRKIHRSIRDIHKATHTLHIDSACPFAPSDDGYSYFLVGALRLPGFPLLIDVRTLTSRTSTEVCDELEKMVAYLEALQTEGLPIGETSRIKRLHSDRAGEFTAPFLARFLGNHKSIHHSFTSGYDPQSNGTAERSVGLIKSLASRALATAELDSSYWSYAVRYASQSLLCHALQKKQRSLPFGTTVVAQVLGHRDVKFPASRSITGRLLYFDHLNDQVSYILCPPGDDSTEPLVHRAGLPAKLPPAINIDEFAGPDPLPSSFDKLVQDKSTEDRMSKDPLDLDPLPSDSLHPTLRNDAHDDKSDDLAKDQEKNDRHEDTTNDDSDDDDVILEFSLSEVHSSLPAECPFTFLYLSSEDSTKDETVDEDIQDCSLPNAPSTQQGTSHVPFTADDQGWHPFAPASLHSGSFAQSLFAHLG